MTHAHAAPDPTLRDPYFLRLDAALKAARIAAPTLIIDRTRLYANIDTLLGHLPEGMGFRIVAKSLPCLPLLHHIRTRTKTRRLMTFNEPMLSAIYKDMPDADQLLGKPLPIEAARLFYERARNPEGLDHIQWLIDTPERLAQYEVLAKSLNRTLRINFEIDVGLHRGDFVPGDAFAAALESVRSSNRLQLAGIMGYEPHLAAIPEDGGWRARATEGAHKLYRAALDQIDCVFGAGKSDGLTRNTAGSPTYRNYPSTELANEISAGSCLVKPTDFDTPLLAPHLAASFIATPALKVIRGTHYPGAEYRDRPPAAGTQADTIFIHGGYWLANPVDPPGVARDTRAGHSSNQERLTAPPGIALAPDDFIFFRPHQSEAVFLQFGDIAVYDGEAIIDGWPVLPASA